MYYVPGYVNFAAGFEDARRDVGAGALVSHHHVGVISPVKSLIRTEMIFYEMDNIMLMGLLTFSTSPFGLSANGEGDYQRHYSNSKFKVIPIVH